MTEEDSPGEGSPAWILCEDLLVRIKEELISEAMRALDRELKSGNIKVNGSLITSAEQDKENEQSLFLINHLIKERQSMHERYNRYMSESNERYDAETISRIDALKRFMLSVDAIALLMDYVNVIDSWIKDISIEVKPSSISDILTKTSESNDKRRELIDFVSKRRRFLDEHVVGSEEYAILSKIAQSQRA